VSAVDDVALGAVATIPGSNAPRPVGDAPDSSRRHLQVAPDPAGRRRLARVLVALGVVITVMSLFVIVASNVVMAQQSFELEKVQDRQRAAQRRNAELRAVVARLSSPTRIVSEAERLGMVPATDFGFVEGATRVPTEAATDDVAETLQDTAREARDADADSTP
jgi:cell division protein FtsB